MNNIINIYCDESSHLLNKDSNVMTIGCVYMPKYKVAEINKRIRNIKMRNCIKPLHELKWVGVRESKIQVYLDLIDYFFDDDDIKCRVIIIPNKNGLRHDDFNQTHDDWYYKMYYNLLNVLFSPNYSYNIYMDQKDSNSNSKGLRLMEILRNKNYDYSGKVISAIQPIRSSEVEVMQLIDILIGAIGYTNRNLTTSSAKRKIIDKIVERSNKNLRQTTLFGETKLNIFVWDRAGDSRGV